MTFLGVVLRNAMNGRLSVAVEKVLRRLEPDTRKAATTWARERAVNVDDFCRALDPVLWDETQQVCNSLRDQCEATLQGLPVKLGGGGAYPLLYFLVRRRQPQILVETGVAAGWSSRALLEAVRANGFGRLYSSDFPYLRIHDPERYIGCLVPESLRSSWHLDVRGDRFALPDFAAAVDAVDFVHYDSDKGVRGRRFALDLLRPKMAPGSLLIMDDINDNTFFKEWVESAGLKATVLSFEGKFIGVVGLA